jgi:hypothetical protein
MNLPKGSLESEIRLAEFTLNVCILGRYEHSYIPVVCLECDLALGSPICIHNTSDRTIHCVRCVKIFPSFPIELDKGGYLASCSSGFDTAEPPNPTRLNIFAE